MVGPIAETRALAGQLRQLAVEEGAEALARAYVEEAHRHGMAIAQKNAVEVAQVAHEEWGFDFAVVEECAVWD